jgi:post-segregation antitoxin (ccd killing protein)
MAELKIEIPDELDKELREFKLDISDAVTSSITEELVRFVALKTIASKSKLTKEDAIELGRKLKEGRFDDLKKKGFL